LAEVERVIDDGCKEVDGLDERAVGAQPVNAGVIERTGADEDVGVVVLRGGKLAQDLRQERLAQFGGSAGAGGELRQADGGFLFALHGVPPFLGRSVAEPCA
jgi:hypothetical protein